MHRFKYPVMYGKWFKMVPYLGTSLLVSILMLHTVHLLAMRLEGAALREALLAQIALVGPHPSVGARVALQIEGVVEPFATEGAQIPLDVRVALHVPIEQALQRERLHADAANELVVGILGATVACPTKRIALAAAVAAHAAAAVVAIVAATAAAAIAIAAVAGMLLTERYMLRGSCHHLLQCLMLLW